MRNTAVLILILETVMALETAGHVVGIEECNLRGLNEAGTAQHLDVCPGDEVDGGATERRRGDGVDGLRVEGGHGGVFGQEGGEMRSNANGSNTGSSSTVRTVKELD